MIENFRFFNLFLVSLTLICSVNSQSLEWSNTQKLRGQSVLTTIVGEDESGIYLMRHRNKFVSKFMVLERYRQNLGFENSKSFILKNSRILYADMNENGIFIVKLIQNRNEKLDLLTMTILNTSFDVIQPETEICKLDNDWHLAGFDPIIKASPDHKHYLMLMPSHKHNFKYAITDTKNSILNLGNFSLGLDHLTVNVKDILFDNALKFTLLIASQTKSGKGIMYSIFENNDLKPINDTNHILIEPKLFKDYNTNISGLTGFYTSNSEHGYEGNFIANWQNQNIDSINLKKIPFTYEILKELEGETKASLGFLNPNFEFIKLIQRSDGGFIKICENKSIRKEQEIVMINGMPSSHGKKIYIFENLLIQNFTSTGQLDWEKTVSKNQNTINDGGYLGSVTIGATSNSINIIYNDPIAVGGDIVLAQFLPNGEKSIKIIAHGDEMNAFIIASEGKQISPYKMVIPVLKDRKFALLKLSFN